MTNYYEKYIKYKNKYLELQQIQQSGGSKYRHNNNDKAVILFKAEWCGHCQNFKDTWVDIQTKYNDKYDFITYDADQDKDMIETYNVKGFPTLLVQNKDKIIEYEGKRETKSIMKFVEKL